ncbi:MAG TPA: alpha/beta fold hydrolase [Albitalea sp.]|nr:alpha/beta fold hydrolase [Albitalea sp.]
MAATPAHANPASAFYAGNRSAQALGTLLRGVDALAPAWGTRAALRLFFTPLPWKLAGRRALPAAWAMNVWPFEGGTLAAYRRSDIAAGRPRVLLVHGWAGHGMQMRALGDALAEAGFDPVLLDFPAHGRSAGWRSSLPQFARAIYAAVSRLGALHAVVAHSLGALAALHAAARGVPAERLVLLAPSPPPAQFLRWFAGSFGLADSVPQRMRERIERHEGVALAEYEPDWLGPRVGQPALVVHDEGDRVAPFVVGERLVDALSSARLHATQGLGHRRVLDDTAVVNAVVRHLEGQG